MQTKTIKLILPLFFLLLSFSAGLAQNKLDFKGDFIWKERHFVWTLEPDINRPQHRRLFIREILKVNGRAGSSQIVYNTSYYARKVQGKLSYIKIFGARRFGYTWSALTTDYVQIGFRGGAVTYSISGDLLKEPKNRSKIADNKLRKTVPIDLAETEAAKLGAEYFIMNFYNLLEGGAPAAAPTKNRTIEDETAFGEKFFYEIKENFFRRGDSRIKVRQTDKSLAYNSLLRLSDDRISLKKITVAIHLAKMKNFSWGIYDSDFCLAVFDYETGKISYERNGSVIPVPEKTTGFPTDFKPASQTPEDCLKTAVGYFGLQYSDKLYLKQ